MEKNNLDSRKPDSQKDSQKPSWGQIQQDLKQALDTWADLSEKYSKQATPEEEKLQEMKKLILEIKSKISELSTK